MESNRFVTVARPRDIRVKGLNAAKETINATRQHFRIEILRNKKVKLIKELKEETKELSLLFGKLYEFLPDHELLEIKKEKTITKKTKAIKSKKKSTEDRTTKSENELDRLEKALMQVEQKLKNI
jgi:hypothetical protein